MSDNATGAPAAHEEPMYYPFQPNWTVPPAEMLLEWAEEAGITAAWLRTYLTHCLPELLTLLNDPPAELTPHKAQQLETLTDIPARLWTRFEEVYRADLVRLAAKHAHEKPRP